MEKILVVLGIGMIVFFGAIYFLGDKKSTSTSKNITENAMTSSPTKIPQDQNHSFPLSISSMKAKSYPGSSITIEQTLPDIANYHQYLTSYTSDGLKIYALLTIPFGNPPQGGFPAILFNHGYIPPAQYSTINSYSIAVDPLASAGYVIFKPDYRGNGTSEGKPTQVYVSSDYVTDSLNALASLKKLQFPLPGNGAATQPQPLVNSDKIGVWGHSMGGNITLHELVISPQDFKAAVIWSGVVGSYSDILSWWNKRMANKSIVGNDLDTYYLVQDFIKEHGTPSSNPGFWNAIDPTQYISDISTPIQIDVGTGDEEVPMSFSSSLRDRLKSAGKRVEYFEYPGADHNLVPDSTTAMQRTINFFNSNLH